MPRKPMSKAKGKKRAARATAKVSRKAARVKRVPMSARLRTLGTEKNADRAVAKKRAPADDDLAAKAIATLRVEFERVFAIKDKLAAESKIGGTEKGRAARGGDEKVRSLLASLEGMNRFALAMGLITPAESRELYAEAMNRGLYQGYR